MSIQFEDLPKCESYLSRVISVHPQKDLILNRGDLIQIIAP